VERYLPSHLNRDQANRQEYLNDHIPSTTSSSTYSSLPPSVRPLRSSLEELDDNISHRSRIISELRQIASNDDIRPEVLKEATKLAHGGTGDVKTEWFEEIFGRGMEKYERLRGEMEEEGRKQDELLEKIRVSPGSKRRAQRVARNQPEAAPFRTVIFAQRLER
jgi:programmed cell death 6-interacting protein